MKTQELIKILEQFNDDCEITIVDSDQNDCYEIIDIHTCEDNSSKYHKAYIDIVIDL
jgi:hypothetical protein